MSSPLVQPWLLKCAALCCAATPGQGRLDKVYRLSCFAVQVTAAASVATPVMNTLIDRHGVEAVLLVDTEMRAQSVAWYNALGGRYTVYTPDAFRYSAYGQSKVTDTNTYAGLPVSCASVVPPWAACVLCLLSATLGCMRHVPP